MVGIGGAVAVAVEALTTRRCMCRAMGAEGPMVGVEVDVIVEGTAAAASAAAAVMEEAVIVAEAEMVEEVEAAAAVVVDATEEPLMATLSPESHIYTR